jgi:hypothetical protein
MERRIKLTWTRTVTNTVVLGEDEARDWFGTDDVLELPAKMTAEPGTLNELEYSGEAEGTSQITGIRADGAEAERDEGITWLYEDADKPMPGTGLAWERTGPFASEDEAFEYWAHGPAPYSL